MSLRFVILLAVVAPFTAAGQDPCRVNPTVFPNGVVNAASFAPAPGNFAAPNGIVAIFGRGLSLQTREATAQDMALGRLPTSLAGVSVTMGGQLVPLFFVSPCQINAQVPSNLVPRDRPWTVIVTRQSLNIGDPVGIVVKRSAPGLFPVAVHQDFTLVGRDGAEGMTPAKPGALVVLFGTAFGPTSPRLEEGRLANGIAWLDLFYTIRLDNRELPAESTAYIGLTPGLAGVFQINLILPHDLPPGDPEVFVEIDGMSSQPGVRIAVDPADGE